MRFALLGNHPDGVEMACALIDSERHELVACTRTLPEEVARRKGEVRLVNDLEELLADPAIEAVIVADRLSVRPEQLRRVLQSERHVLCVHPADQSPEIAYEAALLQKDTGYVLLPLLPEGLHPAFGRLAEFIDDPESPLGAFHLLEIERASTGEVLDGIEGGKPAFPGWDVLRLLGGEIGEVFAFAEKEHLEEGEPVLLTGRFERGGLFQVTLLPEQRAGQWRVCAVGSRGRAEVYFPQGWEGPACLDWRDESGEEHEEYWERWDPWPALVEVFEACVAPDRMKRLAGESTPHAVMKERPGSVASASPGRVATLSPVPLSWQDAVRALELDDAARRSVERRRANVLEYQDVSEEVGFKGTMTLAGCALLWGMLLLLIVSRWVPQVGWLILPLLVVFAGLQLLRYIIPREPPGAGK
jgi:predicted dehydrogenase